MTDQPGIQHSANETDHAAVGVATIDRELAGLRALREALAGRLRPIFNEVVELIHQRKESGRVIISGIGKSGHIGRKIAATLASTGTPAHFVHAAEAAHGDLGMLTRDDVVVILSHSGRTAELAAMIHFATRNRIPLVAITADAQSPLAQAASHLLLLPDAEEGCPLGLAPTTSTTMQLALGDALAMALLSARGFRAADFGQFHPGGNLGALLKPLKDIMHTGEELPLVTPDTPMNEALLEMTGKHFGTVGIVDDEGRLTGIITDGDLRRAMEKHPDLLKLTAADIMSPNPKTMGPCDMASKALGHMNEHQITVLFIVDEARRPVGIVHMHDLLRMEGRRRSS